MVRPFDSDPAVVAWRPGVCTRLLAGAAQGAEALCVIEQWCEPGTGAPTHTHFGTEEVIAVLDGVAEFWVDGETERIEPGGSIVLPAHSRHGFRNAGEGELHTVAVFASARPQVAYESEPETVLEIGVEADRMLDAHRAYRDEARPS
jgi:quercetin dioxygenase-like cupin family protein